MIRFYALSVLVLLLTFNFSFARNQSLVRAVATYECASLYWKTENSGPCKLRYLDTKSKVWTNGLELCYDPRDSEFRGSIVGLNPNNEYIAELETSGSKTSVKFMTRSDKFPVGKTTVLESGETDRQIVITESGSPDAYHLVTVPAGTKSVLNIKNVYESGIEINADYVIIRGVEVRNAAVHGLLIKKGHHDVVVEQCHITFWGRVGGPKTFGNLEGDFDSGVYAERGCYNLTIQRNLIDNPRGASNDWETGHPGGPQGISFMQSMGGNVIRYNDILSTEDHGFNDGIGGGENFDNIGNMNCDGDIYGNIIRSVWDDAIECEGANTNVRIWGNYAHFYYNGIATAPTVKGPLYVYRNVLGESRRSHSNYQGGAVFKTGEREQFGGGRKYFFHNTALQPNGAYNAFTSHVNPNCISRNNIFDVPGKLATDKIKEPLSDYNYDFFSGSDLGTALETNGKEIHTPALGPLYIPSYYLEFYPTSAVVQRIGGTHPVVFGEKTVKVTDPVILSKNPLIDSGIVIPGFNADYKGPAPDMGAFETGNDPLRFGRRANLAPDQGWAPWEVY